VENSFKKRIPNGKIPSFNNFKENKEKYYKMAEKLKIDQNKIISNSYQVRIFQFNFLTFLHDSSYFIWVMGI